MIASSILSQSQVADPPLLQRDSSMLSFLKKSFGEAETGLLKNKIFLRRFLERNGYFSADSRCIKFREARHPNRPKRNLGES